MQPQQMRISYKQAELMGAVRDSPWTGINEIFLIGAIGTSKTFAMGYAHANIAFQYPGSFIPVGRTTLADARIGTFQSYIEVLGEMGLVEGDDYRTRQGGELSILFANRSVIQFVPLDITKDRDWRKIKSINATSGGVDEVDSVVESGYDMLFSRTGRKNQNGAPAVMISCCNPNNAWMKRNVYDPWRKSVGRLPKELIDNTDDLPANRLVLEFNIEDSFLFPTGYYDRYENRPYAFRQRYLRNNWDYQDDENSLFKGRALDTLTIDRLKPGEKYIAVDPNAGGKDRAAIVLWEGDTIVDAELYTTEDLHKLSLPEEQTPFNIGAIIGRLTVAMMKRERVGMHNVCGDVNGPGQGWLTYMLSNGYKVEQFISGYAPVQTAAEKEKNIRPPYGNLRDQMFHLWSQSITEAEVYMYSGMPHLSTLKKELQLHESVSKDKVSIVTPKEDIRKLLGGSPDMADAGMMGYWLRYIRSRGNATASERASVGRSFDELYNHGNGF